EDPEGIGAEWLDPGCPLCAWPIFDFLCARLSLKSKMSFASHLRPPSWTWPMTRSLLVLLLAGLAAPLPGAETRGSEATTLPREVATLLHKRCGECHNDKTAKGRLTLTTPAGVARGGRKGIVVRPGKVQESRLWLLVQGNEMPPETPLAPADREILRRWIE